MAQLIKPNAVKVVTQDGEVKVTIALELTINLNSENMNISSSNKFENTTAKKSVEEKTIWEIPDFVPVPKVGFGKKE